MNRVIIAILPIILIVQLGFHASSLVPSEWIKSLNYGLKWTELMMNGYPGAEEVTEAVPEGVVTTTVVLVTAVPELEQYPIAIEVEICNEQIKEEIERAREEAHTVLVKLKTERMLQVKKALII